MRWRQQCRSENFGCLRSVLHCSLPRALLLPQIDELHKKLHAAAEAEAKLQKAVDSLTASEAELRTQLSAAQSQLSAAQAHAKEQIQTHAASVAQLQTQLEAARVATETGASAKASGEVELKEWRERCAQMEVALAEAKRSSSTALEALHAQLQEYVFGCLCFAPKL
jgi:chromosome segregation ATPase